MRVFVKYVLRSIKKSILQPLFILITLSVAVATMLCSVKVLLQFDREKQYEAETAFNYDLSVSVAPESDVRILITEEVERVLGDVGVALGEFHLKAAAPELVDLDALFELCATDLYEADRFYNFRFTEYGEIRESELAESMILSSLAAEELGLGIGDTVTLRLLNSTFEFKIVAIALPDGSLFQNHGMIDISAVIGALKDSNPAIAHIVDDFQPASIVRVKFHDITRAEEYRDAILNDEDLSHVRVSLESDSRARAGFEQKIWLLLTTMIIFIVILISVIIIATSQSLLAAERRTDTALFMICGAEPSQLATIAYLEAIIYAVIASAYGVLLSFPITSFINNVFEWKYSVISFYPTDIVIAILSSTVIATVSTYINNKRTAEATVTELLSDGRERKHAISGITSSIVWGMLAILSFTVAITLPAKLRYAPALISIVFIVLFAYMALPRLVFIICNYISALMHRLKRIPPKLYLSLKTIGTTHSLLHSIRILSILAALLITVSFYLLSSQRELDTLGNLLDCTYIAISVDEDDDELISTHESVEDIFRISVINTASTEEGDAMLCLSADEIAYSYLNEKILPNNVVQLGEIAISQGLAAKYQKKIGDEFTILNESESYILKICDILNIGSNFAVLDARSIGNKNDIVCIQMKSDVSVESVSDLTSELEARGSIFTTLNTITEAPENKISSFISLISVFVTTAFISIMIGIANLVITAYKGQKRERELYFTVGMTKADIALINLLNWILMAAICLIIIPVIATVSILLMNMAANSFGFDVIY